MVQLGETYILPISSKGQVTIPARIREKLALDRTKKVMVKVQNGDVFLKPMSLGLEDVYASVKPIKKSFAEIRRIAREERLQKRTRTK